MQRSLTDEEAAIKRELDEEVEAALTKRRQWLDKMAAEIATLKVGDDIYDIDKGIRLGVVSQIYRYGASQDKNCGLLTVDYQYRASPDSIFFDNTSRRIGISFGSKADAMRRAESNLRKLAEL